MRILLHTCCGPCFLFPLAALKEKGYAPATFFYNPNIHPFSEYIRREQAVRGIKHAAEEGYFSEYQPQDFFRAVYLKENPPQRCHLCWRLRLRKTASFAKEKHFDCFSSTLLVSPYQDHAALRRIGEEEAAEAGIAFYYEDFRPGFRQAHEEAKQQGMYCQNYCGCIYSEIERYHKMKPVKAWQR